MGFDIANRVFVRSFLSNGSCACRITNHVCLLHVEQNARGLPAPSCAIHELYHSMDKEHTAHLVFIQPFHIS